MNQFSNCQTPAILIQHLHSLPPIIVIFFGKFYILCSLSTFQNSNNSNNSIWNQVIPFLKYILQNNFTHPSRLATVKFFIATKNNEKAPRWGGTESAKIQSWVKKHCLGCRVACQPAPQNRKAAMCVFIRDFQSLCSGPNQTSPPSSPPATEDTQERQMRCVQSLLKASKS